MQCVQSEHGERGVVTKVVGGDGHYRGYYAETWRDTLRNCIASNDVSRLVTWMDVVVATWNNPQCECVY